MLLVPIVPPLLAAGMPSADDCACGSVPHCAPDYSTACRASSPISGTLVVLLLLALLLLLGLRLLLGLCLLLRLSCRWCLRGRRCLP
jgi:hypothetical protein